MTPPATLPGRATLLALQGTLSSSSGAASSGASPWDGLPPAEEIVERRDGDAALVLAWSRTLQQRLDDAIAEDAAAVVVADGSSLPVEAAERFLAAKEESRVYPPLRTALARSHAPFRRFSDRRNEWRRALLLEVNDVDPARVKRLVDFLASSTGELAACREALASLGGVPLDDSHALARGLDLPDPDGFGGERFTGLARLCLPALPSGAAGAKRVTAPRRLAGHVVVDASSAGSGVAVRLMVAPTLSAGRFLDQVMGFGRALALSSSGGRAGLAHAGGLGLAVASEEVRRALDESRSAAARAARVVVATLFVRARLQAAVAVVAAKKLDGEEEREEARAAVRTAAGVDGGLELATRLLLGPLPDGLRLQSPEAAVVDDAVAAVDVAGSFLSLREELDAGFLLRPRVLGALRELPPSTEDAATAWRRLLGELL